MNISSQLDSGNIEVVSANAPDQIKLKIRKDTNADFLQWFHFKVSEVQGVPCSFTITNASQTSYPEGWVDYDVCVSYDKENWFRIPTTYKEGQLTFKLTPTHSVVYFAYFPPYTYERHQQLISKTQLASICTHQVIGQTVEGRDIDLLVIGEENPEKKKIWVTARQHPGESMAEWFIEGFLERLLNHHDSVSRLCLEKACFYAVPNLNIDGSIAGNLRTNVAGVNLNRVWDNPSTTSSPEAYHVMQHIKETGINLLIDVHGDEELPYNFVTTSEGVPGYDEYMKDMEERFIEFWTQTCPDFQNTFRYPLNEPNKANLSIFTKQVAYQFKALSFTLELPFKDNKDFPNSKEGWSDKRSIELGKSSLLPILHLVDHLR